MFSLKMRQGQNLIPAFALTTSFLEYIEIEKGLSPSTVKNYSYYLKKFFDWLSIQGEQNILPKDISENHIRRYRLFLSRKTGKNPVHPWLSKESQNVYIISLRVFFRFLALRGIPCFSFDKIPLAKTSQSRSIKFLTIEQLEIIFAVPNTQTPIGLRDRALLEMLFSTGLRISELLSLKRDHFPLSKIRSRHHDVFELSVKGKGGKRRPVYFSARSLLWLGKYLDSRTDDSEWLFIHFRRGGNENRILSSRSVQRIVQSIVKRSGVPIQATPHTFRHSYATDLLSQGADVRMVQELLGHKNISTTQIYTHITNPQLKHIHKKFHTGHRIIKK